MRTNIIKAWLGLKSLGRVEKIQGTTLKKKFFIKKMKTRNISSTFRMPDGIFFSENNKICTAESLWILKFQKICF